MNAIIKNIVNNHDLYDLLTFKQNKKYRLKSSSCIL